MGSWECQNDLGDRFSHERVNILSVTNMEINSIVNLKNGEKIYLQNEHRTPRCKKQEVTMPYKLSDLVVLIVARLSRQRIAVVYRAFWKISRFTMRLGRKFKGTSDKSPR